MSFAFGGHCFIYMHHHGTEEIAHWEMIGVMINQSMRNASLDELTEAGLIGYYTIHGYGIYPADPNGIPFTAAYIQCTGDPITDINEDLAADGTTAQEQQCRKPA